MHDFDIEDFEGNAYSQNYLAFADQEDSLMKKIGDNWATMQLKFVVEKLFKSNTNEEDEIQ